MSKYEAEKTAVLEKIAEGKDIKKSDKGKGMYYIGEDLVHIRYNSQDPNIPFQFWFSIYSSALVADYEVWVLGNTGVFYTIPSEVIKKIYDDPDAYLDKSKDGRVVIVTIQWEDESRAIFSRKTDKLYIEYYFQCTIDQVKDFQNV